jgi:hypothetical protein
VQKPDDLVEVFVTDNANEAEILRAALNGEGMKCEISGEHQGGLTGIGVMKIRLFVRAADIDRARIFLERHHHGR